MTGSPPDDAPPPLREVIRRHGLAAKRALGQHFLLDANLNDRIARQAGALDRGTTVEIGPGPGGLTRALLRAGARQVAAVERDPRCVTALAELQAFYGARLRVMSADALEVDVAALGPPPLKIVANLPYNIATPLLIGWLRGAGQIASMTLMFQKEVADRLTAPPGEGAYGRLSVVAQWRCAVRACFDISPRAFTPPPKVASTLVSLIPRARPIAVAMVDLERVTAAAFGQRRKMLRGSLRALGVDVARLLERAGADARSRAEDLDPAAFCALACAYRELVRTQRSDANG